MLDGREWHRRGERFEARYDGVVRTGIAPASSLDALLRYRNPLGIANYVNHVPVSGMPNAMCCELEIDPSALSDEAKALLPNDVAQPSTMMSRFSWHMADGGKVRALAAIALDDIENEEIFLNYRFNPANEHPDWYYDPDPESAHRRWQKVAML